MALKLYFVPNTRSTRVRWVLEELAVPHELVRLDPKKGDTKSASYLKIHPLGHVPALQDGDTTLIESAAIVMYIADRYGAGRLSPPLSAPERGEYYQWIMLAHATLEPVLGTIFDHKQGKPVDGATLSYAKKRVRDIMTAIDTRLGGRSFAAGSTFTAADIVLAAAINWANMMGLLHDFPRLQAYSAKHLRRPAARKSREA